MSSPNPKITVGLPFYNASKTLAGAIRSVFAQTFTDWELIMVDDGSTDDSLEIARKVNDPRVRVISDGAHKKLAARLNEITRLARGQFIGRLDADDLCDPTRFEKQIAFLESNPKVDLVSSDWFSLGPNDELKGCRYHPTTHEEICRSPLVKGINICHACITARRGWFEKHPYPEEYSISQDSALWLSSWADSTFACLPEPLYYFREYGSYSLRKFCRSKMYYIKAIWQYGRVHSCLLPVIIATMGVLARLGIAIILSIFHLQQHIIARHSRPPTQDQVQRFQNALEVIRNTPVPGLD